MRVERSGQVVRVRSAANHRDVGGADERAEAEWQAVCDFQMAGLGGLPTRQSQRRCGRRRRAVDQGVRAGPEREPLQTLESAVVGKLLPGAGAGSRNTEEARARRGQGPRGAHGGGPYRSNGGAPVPGAEGGTTVPPGLVRLSTGAIGSSSTGGLPRALLEK